MLKTNFDDLELSLSLILESVKRNQLLKKASLVKKTAKYDNALMEQLEDQAKFLNLIKDHYRELKVMPDWKELEKKSIALLTCHKLFEEGQAHDYQDFKQLVRSKILAVRSNVDEELNKKIVDRGMEHARRTTRVKTFKHWNQV